ncbi:protein-disulfide reductase DsbD [Pseudomonas sp. F1_0610]|uniref:protein-disulfide reductase DsbD n=1 Tax=Pseudomonas sp. F1_0610 TaxID=3114284 RepID=UPI0039C3901B
MPRFFLAFLLLWVYSAQASLPMLEQHDFLPVEEAFKFEFDPKNAQQIKWDIAPGYYLYSHRTGIRDEQGNLIPLNMPEGIPYSDEFFGDSTIYRYNLNLNLPEQLPENYTIVWQGCSEKGLCYPPQAFDVDSTTSSANNLAEDQSIAERLANSSLFVNVLFLFGMGLLLAFTPCTLPMIPILTSVIGGNKLGGWSGARYGLAFVLPMAIIYAGLGVLAASLGKSLQAMLQQTWLLVPFATLFIILAIAQFGIFRLELPAFIRDRLSALDSKQTGGKYIGAMVMGALSAVLVGPCMTAPLAGVLLYIAQTGNATTGALALFALGIGIGTPLLLAISFGTRWLPKPGDWMETVNHVFGFALLAAAIFVLRAILDENIVLGLWAVWLLGVAVFFAKNNLSGRKKTLFQYLGVLLGMWSAIMLLGFAAGGVDPLKPLAQWQTASSSPSSTTSTLNKDHKITSVSELKRQLEQARNNKQWALIDFYADWCVSCKIMERDVFGNPQVINALQDVVIITFDVTDGTDEQNAYMKEVGVFAPPSILFFAPDGNEKRAGRITGEVNAQQFLTHLKQIQQ